MKPIVKGVLGLFVLLAAILTITSCSKLTADVVQVTGTFEWTATGDDGVMGTASQYSLRYSTDSTALINSWNTCIIIPGLPAPKIAGNAESFTTTMNLNNGTTYFFAIKAADEVPNWSLVSNIVRVHVADDKVPLAIDNLKFTRS